LGLNIHRDGAVKVERRYVLTLLQQSEMADTHPVGLPMDVGVKSQNSGAPLTAELFKVHQELVGRLLYLYSGTRPDTACAVGWLMRFMSTPTMDHLAAARAVLRCLEGTAFKGSCYQADIDLQENCDASFAADVDTLRSTSAHSFIYNWGAVAWGGNVQPAAAAFKSEAAYILVAVEMQEAVWLRRPCRNLIVRKLPVTVLRDNQSARAMINNPVSSARTKHIGIYLHFVLEPILNDIIKVFYVMKGTQKADVLHKPLGTIGFLKCVASFF